MESVNGTRLVNVERTVDQQRIGAFLAADRLWGAYALGDLDPGLFGLCEWAVAVEDGRDVALGLYFGGLSLGGLLTIGDPAGVGAILGSVLTPPIAHFSMEPPHRSAVERTYELGAIDRMLRMVVDRATFRPVEPRLGVPPPARLTVADLPRLNALYSGGDHDAPDAFAAFQIEQGVFYGIPGAGGLVAAAGTHIVAPAVGIAAVGNVYTAPSSRGQGLAQACTSAVVAACLDLGCRDIVLNVNSGNAPAVAAYRRLGFSEHCIFLEVTGTRRET